MQAAKTYQVLVPDEMKSMNVPVAVLNRRERSLRHTSTSIWNQGPTKLTDE